MMDVRNYRCCMCPQLNSDSHVCPTGPGKTEESVCDFVVTWTDARGWKYRVMGDLAGTFKGRYQDNKHSGDFGWKGMRQMERRETFDEAQADLNLYAKKKGWYPIANH